MAKIVPAVEIVAPRGSVVFWHHRLAHAAGINRSQQIRHAVLADYPPSNYEAIAEGGANADQWQHWAI